MTDREFITYINDHSILCNDEYKRLQALAGCDGFETREDLTRRLAEVRLDLAEALRALEAEREYGAAVLESGMEWSQKALKLERGLAELERENDKMDRIAAEASENLKTLLFELGCQIAGVPGALKVISAKNEALEQLENALNDKDAEIARLQANWEEAQTQLMEIANENDDTIRSLRNVCGEAYQLAGAIGAPVAVLDNLGDAAAGGAMRHETFLPVMDTDCIVVQALEAQLAEAREDSRRLREALTRMTVDDWGLNGGRIVKGNTELTGCKEFYKGFNSGIDAQFSKTRKIAIAAISAARGKGK